jgi:ankyrin repeat protein
VMRLLVEMGGADKDAKDGEGARPMHHAAYVGQVEAIKLLVQMGADKDATDKDGGTPLHCAAYKGHVHTMHTLVQLGVDKEAKNVHGSTAMHVAAAEGARGGVEGVGEAGLGHRCSDS